MAGKTSGGAIKKIKPPAQPQGQEGRAGKTQAPSVTYSPPPVPRASGTITGVRVGKQAGGTNRFDQGPQGASPARSAPGARQTGGQREAPGRQAVKEAKIQGAGVTGRAFKGTGSFNFGSNTQLGMNATPKTLGNAVTGTSPYKGGTSSSGGTIISSGGSTGGGGGGGKISGSTSFGGGGGGGGSVYAGPSGMKAISQGISEVNNTRSDNGWTGTFDGTSSSGGGGAGSTAGTAFGSDKATALAQQKAKETRSTRRIGLKKTETPRARTY